MNPDEILLQRLAAIPSVWKAVWKPLTPEQEIAVGGPGRAAVCYIGGKVDKYVQMGPGFLARGELYLSETVIQDLNMHDNIVANMERVIDAHNNEVPPDPAPIMPEAVAMTDTQ